MDGKQLYKNDPDGWWENFWAHVGMNMVCDKCPFEGDECKRRGCGNTLADHFLREHTEGQYEW